MANYIFRLPDIGEGVAEAEIVAWHIEPGARLQEDQAMVDVMTDKATVEMTSPVAGIVTAVHGSVGQRVPVGSPLVELDLDGEDPAEPQQQTQAAATAPVAVTQPAKMPPGDALLAAPATRKRAQELGIALQSVPGTGPAGRITPDDLEAFISAGGPRAPVTAGLAPRLGVTETKIVGLRRKIAEKMQDSKRRIPHFAYIEEFDLTELEALRKDLNENRDAGQPKLTLLPFLMRAMVKVLPKFPSINARYDDDAGILHVHDGIHIGIATQTPDGLMVPVIRHAETLDLWESAQALTRVTTAARDGSATRDELMGSTITLTSLGAIGGIAATPVINHPEVAIIGPNKLVERPMVVNGQIVIRTMMNLSASFDHRIVDGYDAAQFIQGLKRLMERPALLFLEPK
jgi:2-oxoisovalerate dehydrogenase E2 component (dihydrolipoyl transacylase)